MKKITSFLMGVSSLLDLTGTRKFHLSYYDYFSFGDLPSYANPDTDAIAKDWAVVGQDMSRAFQKYEEENHALVP